MGRRELDAAAIVGHWSGVEVHSEDSCHDIDFAIMRPAHAVKWDRCQGEKVVVTAGSVSSHRTSTGGHRGR
jgi:hypothetical protein